MLALAAVVWLALGRERPAADARAVAPPAASERSEVVPAPRPADALPPLAGLRGTEPSGALELDGDGHFVPTRDALLFFQYFLSASNEATPDEIAAHLDAAIRARLDPPADAEAAAFLARYMAYLAAGDEEFREPGLTDEVALDRRIQWVRELRREYFGAELAEALFGEGEDALRIQLERRRIAADASLDPDAVSVRLLELEAEFPEPVREARARASLPLRLAHEERALREAGASEAEIDALRARHVGPEAATRLRALDRERAAWDARLAAYRNEREAQLAGVSDPAERTRIAERVRAEHFTSEEQRRVEILDRQAAEEAP